MGFDSVQSPSPTIVIGGGISGLSCAFRLRQMGRPVLLLEQADRFGGVIGSVKQDGFLFELGPQSFLSNDSILELVGALGIEGELCRADPRAPRYVWIDGRLLRVPLSPPELLSTSLLGARTKMRLLLEPLRRSRPPVDDESVADFVRRKFGPELLDHLVGPLVSGVYAGDPEKLSLRSAFPVAYEWERDFGSVLRGAMKSRPPKNKPRPTLCSFPEGVETLVHALAKSLGEAARLGVEVRSIHRGKSNGKSSFELCVTHNGRTEFLAASTIVVATPTEASGRLLAGVSPRFPEEFSRIAYAPVAVVSEGYRREQVHCSVDGFGFLVPRKAGLRVLGTVWGSSLFPGRAPEGMVSMTSFAGGATDPELCALSEDKISEIVQQELAGVMQINGPPVARRVHRWARALPQYNLGHAKTVKELRELAAGLPGLFLAGNYLGGPSIGACVEQAFQTAGAVEQYLGSLGETGAACAGGQNMAAGSP